MSSPPNTKKKHKISKAFFKLIIFLQPDDCVALFINTYTYMYPHTNRAQLDVDEIGFIKCERDLKKYKRVLLSKLEA